MLKFQTQEDQMGSVAETPIMKWFHLSFIPTVQCLYTLNLTKWLYSGLGFRKWAKESKNFLEVSLAPDSASNWS